MQDRALIKDLERIVGREDVLFDPTELLVYECDALTTHKSLPRAVVIVSSTDEVSKTVKLLNSLDIPFLARGAGTGLSGGATALDGSIIIEMSRMNRILRISYEDRLAVVETGLININLTRTVEDDGYFYAPDPSSQTACTIGGNIAENAGGPHCLKYGSTVNHILALRVVLPDGSIVDLGSKGADSVGYDLVGLFVGSEGTFGIATEATLKLQRMPEAIKTMLADFPTTISASRAVSSIIAAGILPSALEMMDKVTINAVEDSVFAAGMPRDAAAVVIIELDGTAVETSVEAERVREICLSEGARSVWIAKNIDEKNKIWAGRKGAFGAMGRIKPDLMVQDGVIPRSKLPEVLDQIYQIAEKYSLKISNVFHAGDGNLHPNISYDGRDTNEVTHVKAACEEIMGLCISVGGSITGEHGVGTDKLDYVKLIFTPEDINLMACIRACFNPKGLSNPRKTIPSLRCRAY
ncbi:MAG: FAD-binding protein [Blastocatellia bacterium]|nr:FAD-binding protein [Blastocatellia bacterium]